MNASVSVLSVTTLNPALTDALQEGNVRGLCVQSLPNFAFSFGMQNAQGNESQTQMGPVRVTAIQIITQQKKSRFIFFLTEKKQ